MPTQRRVPVVHPFDLAHGTDTSGLIPGTEIVKGTDASVPELTAYYGIAPSILEGLLDCWLNRCAPQTSIVRTVFLDVGAGKGRALLLASRYPFLRVEGVELNAKLARIAQRNVALWRGDASAHALAPIQLHHGDATRHPLPAEACVAFLFHPFEKPLLRRFLRHIARGLAASPRPFDLLYANAEHGSLLDWDPDWQRLWVGRVAMTPEDHLADLAEIEGQEEYGSTGDELCAIYRYKSTI